MRTLTLALAMAWGLVACGGGSKPPMQPDNDLGSDAGEPSAPPAAAAPSH